MIFGNRTLAVHLLRGAAGFAALYVALRLIGTSGWPSLLLAGSPIGGRRRPPTASWRRSASMIRSAKVPGTVGPLLAVADHTKSSGGQKFFGLHSHWRATC